MGVRCEAAVRWLHVWLLSDLVRVSVRTGVMMIELTWELLNIVTPRWSGFYFWILFDFWFASVRFHAVTLCWKVFNAMDSARCVYTHTHTHTHTLFWLNLVWKCRTLQSDSDLNSFSVLTQSFCCLKSARRSVAIWSFCESRQEVQVDSLRTRSTESGSTNRTRSKPLFMTHKPPPLKPGPCDPAAPI